MFTTLSAMVVACAMLLPNASVFAATYSQELQDAYNWAYSKGVTTMSPIDNANMYGAITRSEMAKMLSVYATEVLGMTPDTTAACAFSDIDSVKGDLHDYIIESCELGIMGQGITAFRPYDTISRAEFGTALSRVLWGNQYEGGTPYYAKHLDALKAAGIMTQIANAESTKEVRGYVMLMLMRSEGNDAVVDCDDPMTIIACTTDTDACPAACREDASDNGDEETDTVVKSGDLAVSASANSSKKVIKWGVSDLDTLKFKTSEDVEITKITLERYGYSTYESVNAVWLEDEDGNVIAEERDVNSKDVVTLSLKKDYRTVNGILNATVVVRMNSDIANDPDTDDDETFSVGSTIWFKVTDVSSTAKNVDLGDYSPYTYEIVDYTVGGLIVSANGTLKKYNYEAGESYEIARFKLKAGNAAISLNGFTLVNGGNLSADEFIDNLVVTVEGEKVNGLKYSFNKDDELVVSFDEVKIDIRKNVTVVVSASFNEEFDEYGNIIAYIINDTDDVNATETKTSARVEVTGNANLQNPSYNEDGADDWRFPAYKFNGSKIKLSGTKLGNIDAAQGAEGIVIAEWEITLGEPIYKWTVKVPVTSWGTALSGYVDKLTLVINGDDYDSKYDANGDYYYFSNVEIEKSGKVQLKIDIENDEDVTWTIKFGSLKFEGFVYETNKKVDADPTGSITVSNVTIQAAKASLENDLTKSVEFVKETGARKTVFEGTYTAKKGDVYLNKFIIVADQDEFPNDNANDRTFYLIIDGEEVGDTSDVYCNDNFTKDDLDKYPYEDFSDVKVGAGKSVKVKVEADIDSDTEASYDYTLYVWWEDENNNSPSGIGYDDLVTIKVVEKGTVTIPTASSSKNDVILKAKNQKIAEFTVKPSNNNEGLDLENLLLRVTVGDDDVLAADDGYKVKVWKTDYSSDCDSLDEEEGVYECIINDELPTAWLVVQVTLKKEQAGTVTLEVLAANIDTDEEEFKLPESALRTYKAKYQSALVYIASQTNEGSYTSYELWVQKYDDDYEISNISFGTGSSDGWCTGLLTFRWWEPEDDGDVFEFNNEEDTQNIECVSYTISWGDLDNEEEVTITIDDSKNYFKVNRASNGASLRVFAKD